MRVTVIVADLLVFIPAALAIAGRLRGEAQATHRRRHAAAAKKSDGDRDAPSADKIRGGAATPDPPSLRRRRADRQAARAATPERRVESLRARGDPLLPDMAAHWVADALPLLAMPALLVVDHGHFQVGVRAGRLATVAGPPPPRSLTQYNGVALGLSLLAVHCIARGAAAPPTAAAAEAWASQG